MRPRPNTVSRHSANIQFKVVALLAALLSFTSTVLCEVPYYTWDCQPDWPSETGNYEPPEADIYARALAELEPLSFAIPESMIEVVRPLPEPCD